MDDRFRHKINFASNDADIKLSFFIHVSAYLAVNALLIAINLHGASNHFWAKWPILIWGLILVVHVIFVLRLGNQKSGNIRRDMVNKELRGL